MAEKTVSEIRINGKVIANLNNLYWGKTDTLYTVQSSSNIPSFAEATWYQISKVASNHTAYQYFSVGDEKTITLFTGESITLVIIGFDHDDLTSSGKAGMTIMMKHCLATQYPNHSSQTNTVGWSGCTMRTSVMATLLSQLPSDLQNYIVTVKKYTSIGNKSSTIETTQDKLFLLSTEEVSGIVTSGLNADGEGEQYAYFKNIATTNSSRIKKLSNGSGSAAHWKLRSPNLSYTTHYNCISTAGAYNIRSGASSSRGVSFAFCIGEGESVATTYTIKFIANGKTYALNTIKQGEQLTSLNFPTNPTRTDWDFLGWYDTYNNNTRFSTNTTATKDMVITAKWSQRTQTGTETRTCESCYGSGTISSYCERCNGSGIIDYMCNSCGIDLSSGNISEGVCPKCGADLTKANAVLPDEPCYECGGDGSVDIDCSCNNGKAEYPVYETVYEYY